MDNAVDSITNQVDEGAAEGARSEQLLQQMDA
jgi:hypothetical protein